ncbi:lipocalin family protein [Chryseobacterium sp. MEBOG06]|uniref:lipocalin family protein n=1 Tax=unclassified Chryseobacterium TaxID=2593645 RepID=UPI001F3FC492|nr:MULTISPECIES: lipocalin family protein [unclassified Chryseobacterium]UKB82217.1 lipocalin family protein [Chryseobacterium sp. MEBOG06]
MKKVLAGILFTGVLSSCNMGDSELPAYENNENNNTMVVGVWKIQTQYQISGADKTTVIKETLPDDCKKQGTYEFRNDGKYYMIDYNTINGNCVKAETTSSYQYDPVQMKLTINNSSSEVLDLSANKLTILAADTQDFNGDGINDYIKTVFYK